MEEERSFDVALGKPFGAHTKELILCWWEGGGDKDDLKHLLYLLCISEIANPLSKL